MIEFLADKDLLLLLDNCEHLVEAAAQLAEARCSTAGLCAFWPPAARHCASRVNESCRWNPYGSLACHA